jgi:hypothetical protein
MGGIVLGAAAPILFNIGIVIMIGTVVGLINGVVMRFLRPTINSDRAKDVLGLFGPFAIASLIGAFVIVPSTVIVIYNRLQPLPFNNIIHFPISLAGYQLIYMGISIGIGLGGGVLTALLSLCDEEHFSLPTNERIFGKKFGLNDDAIYQIGGTPQ